MVLIWRKNLCINKAPSFSSFLGIVPSSSEDVTRATSEYFRECFQFILAIYYYISFLFLINFISVNTVKIIIFVVCKTIKNLEKDK